MTALPNLLTMSRIAAIPLIVILLYFDAPHWRWLALGFLILGDGGAPQWPISLIGEIGLWAAAALTLVTGYDYLKAGLKHM